jgi:hypothetical protein
MDARRHPNRPTGGAADGQPAVSLDLPGLLSLHLVGWLVRWFPTAGEAFVVGERPTVVPQRVGDLLRPRRTLEERLYEYAVAARGEIRRWIRHNHCCYLWTLTFAIAEYDYEEAARAIDRFFRRLSEGQSGGTPLLAILEPHPNGHGWHAHVVTDRFIPHERMKAAWAMGIVDVRGPKGTKGPWGTRALATYLCKYATKGLVEEELYGCSPRPMGHHRYFKTQGHEPPVVVGWCLTLASALDQLERRAGPFDVHHVFGALDDPRPVGIWLAFPDVRRNFDPEWVKAESRAKRGQP